MTIPIWHVISNKAKPFNNRASINIYLIFLPVSAISWKNNVILTKIEEQIDNKSLLSWRHLRF